MLKNQERSGAFNFALKAIDLYGKFMGFVILWSFWAVFFSGLESILIGKIIFSFIAIGLSFMPLLVDFNESHATNPLWTGHARFHLVWQVCALIFTGFSVLILLWIFPSFNNLLISISLIFLWIICFLLAWFSMPLYGGKLTDVNGVPPMNINLFGRKFEIDRNVHGIVSATVLCTYACMIIFLR